jgi:ACS family allantoate permease-like MFS transporter
VGFGFTEEQSLLYGTPAGAVEVIALLFCSYFGDRYKQRILFGCIGEITAIVGVVLIVALPLTNNVGRLIGYYLTLAAATAFVALLSLISSNIAGYTKKITVAALYLIGYCVGNIIGRQIQSRFRFALVKANCVAQGHKYSDPKIPLDMFLQKLQSLRAGLHV